MTPLDPTYAAVVADLGVDPDQVERLPADAGELCDVLAARGGEG